MVWLFGSFYIIIGIITIVLVLLHSGRGGGMGASAASSTSMERNLDRLTVVFSLVFSFLTLTLAFLIEI